MALCSPCRNITLSANDPYWLLDAKPLAESAKMGCAGCNFVLQAAELRWSEAAVRYNFMKDGIRVYLKRKDEGDTGVGLHILDGENIHIVPLRLCSSYGYEPLPSAESEESEGKFLGRLITAYSGDEECLDLATGWLEKCSKHHGGSCRPLEPVLLPTRLVYIPRSFDKPLQLRITKGLTGQYVALSYCWGAGMAYKTTSMDFDDRLKGFDIRLLPKTLQDAISVTRRLGFEYIWIDALCIIQGDFKDWARESSQMSQVYGNASLTVSADLAGSSDHGLFQPRRIVYSHTFGSGEQYRLQTRAVIHEGTMGWDRVPYERLGRRGWALQERVLSSRILHFLVEQLAWECNTTVYMEDTRGRQTNQVEHFAITRYSKFVKEPLILNTELTRKASKEIDAGEQEHEAMLRINAWLGLVQESSIRDLTVCTDKLPSLSGLATAIEVPYLGKYLAGMWESWALICLSWFPRYPQKANLLYRAPSWSWAAIEGQIMGYYKTWDYKREDKEEWRQWFAQLGPTITAHHIVPKDANNPKGEVEEGSYIEVTGYHREIYIVEEPGTTHNPWEWLHIRSERQKPKAPRKVHMDIREQDRDSTSYFTEEFSNRNVELDPSLVKKLACLQISREVTSEFPKIIALILEGVDGIENGFRRVGLLALSASETNDFRIEDWKRSSLKLS